MGECKNDLGGYFIIDGKEKTIVSQEKFADKSAIKEKIRDGFKYLKYHFPKEPQPKNIVFLNSVFTGSAICTKADSYQIFVIFRLKNMSKEIVCRNFPRKNL